MPVSAKDPGRVGYDGRFGGADGGFDGGFGRAVG